MVDPFVRAGALWPWVGRFLWSPAADLHPSRRAALLPGWPLEAWSNPAALAHVSCHLLREHGLEGDTGWDSSAPEFSIALLPQQPLARLARRMGFTLCDASSGTGAAELDESERLFIARRARLYWRGPVDCGSADPEAVGWHALRVLTGSQSEGITRRFAWKTPLAQAELPALPSSSVLLALARKLLKEFEAPWCSSFAMLRRPERQIRLCG